MDSSSSFRALALRASYSLDPGAPGSGSPVGLNTGSRIGHALGWGLVSEWGCILVGYLVQKKSSCFWMNICPKYLGYFLMNYLLDICENIRWTYLFQYQIMIFHEPGIISNCWWTGAPQARVTRWPARWVPARWCRPRHRGASIRQASKIQWHWKIQLQKESNGYENIYQIKLAIFKKLWIQLWEA